MQQPTGELAAQAMNFCVPALLAGDGRCCQCVVQGGKAFLYLPPRLFVEGDTPIIRQRFGDSNQAIYQYSGQTDGATTDQFPDHRVRKDIPNSHRFGQAIANLAMPLAAVPQNLFGGGPPPGLIASETSTKNAVFLFGDQTVVHVIPAYA
jgi:hypothetical protein